MATTNYDNLIERALGWDWATWLDSEKLQRVFRKREHVVAHLHGHYDEPRSVILGIGSYDELLKSAGAQGLSHALAAMSSLVLIGVGEGVKDPNWSALRRWMAQAFPGQMHPHFRLCRESEHERLAEEHQGERILPVVYGDRFEDLAPFLRDLAPGRAARHEPRVRVERPRTPDVSTSVGKPDMIITVDPMGHGDFTSIRPAIGAAPPGAQLNIRPGNYLEELIIDKPITIAGVGDAPTDVKLMGSKGHTIQFAAPFGSLRNLSLRQTDGSNSYCIDIVAGRLDRSVRHQEQRPGMYRYRRWSRPDHSKLAPPRRK